MNPFGLPEDLVNTLVANRIVAQLAFLAAVGGLSAALVKALEDLSWIKSSINRNFLKAWFAERLRGNLFTLQRREHRILGLRAPAIAPPEHSRNKPRGDAWSQAIELCAAGQERALTELDTAQICGQLNSAAQIVFQFPAQYRSLFEVFAAGAPAEDVAAIMAEHPAEKNADHQNARTRISHYLQRSVDALHILLDARWKWWRHLAGFLFSAGIVLVVMISKSTDHGNPGLFVFHLVVAALVGGFLAPVARGVVTAIQNRGQ